MRFLIAGYGSIGRRHLRNLRALGQEDLVLLRSHQSTIPEDEIQDVPVETNIENALGHHPDGVIISNPTALHLDVAIPAARAGCAILMEKPISDRPDRIPILMNALSEGGGRLLMGFQYRFHPGLLKLRQLIEEEQIGRPLSFQANWGEYLPDWHPWEDYRKSYSARKDLGGGVALTLCHPLDTIRWLFGDGKAIWGFNGQISDLELAVDDIAEIGMQLENGMVGSIHLDYYRRFVRNDLEVTGTEGILHWNNADALVSLQNEAFPEKKVFLPGEGFDRNWLFLDEMRHFLDVVQYKKQPSCTLEDGINAEFLVSALKRSWREKKIIDIKGNSNLA